MINFKFVKSQFKTIIIPLIVFFFVLLILIIPALTVTYFGSAMWITKTGPVEIIPHVYTAGGSVLAAIYFGIPGFITIVAFSIILIHILISREVDRGYLASWLTTPMSRRTILNSKFFVLISSVLGIYSLIFLFQLITFPIIFKDFNIQILKIVLLYNFAFIVLALFWTSINWFIICSLKKTAITISIASAIWVFFITCAFVALLGELWQRSSLKMFKYLTITSLLNQPFKFAELPNAFDSSIPVGFDGIVFAKIIGPKKLDFVWQLLVMFILPFGFFYLGSTLFIKRDFQV